MTLLRIRPLEIHFIIYISEQNGQHENLNIINRLGSHNSHSIHLVGEKTQQMTQAFYIYIPFYVHIGGKCHEASAMSPEPTGVLHIHYL